MKVGSGRVFHKKPEPLLLKKTKGSDSLDHHSSACFGVEREDRAGALVKKGAVNNIKIGRGESFLRRDDQGCPEWLNEDRPVRKTLSLTIYSSRPFPG